MRIRLTFEITRDKPSKGDPRDPIFESHDTHSERERSDQTGRIGFTIPSSAEPYYPDEEERHRRAQLTEDFWDLIHGRTRR